MSVIIEDMKLPESCEDCLVVRESTGSPYGFKYCPFTKKWVDDLILIRHDECPLKEIKGVSGTSPAFVPAWVYYNPPGFERFCKGNLEKIEKALGFRLFVWQKTYLTNGLFRRYGVTTAKVLKELLTDVNAEPLDYSGPSLSCREQVYKEQLFVIKDKLDAAGIKTRRVQFVKLGKHQRKELE